MGKYINFDYYSYIIIMDEDEITDNESENYSDDDYTIDEELIYDDEIDTISNSIISNTIVSNDESYINSYKNKKDINPYLTKFELTKILSIRTQQIAKGSPTLVEIPTDLLNTKVNENIDIHYEIARLELKENKCPLMIRRYINNKHIDVKINDLINKYDY